MLQCGNAPGDAGSRKAEELQLLGPWRLFDQSVGRWFIKRWAEQAIDGLRRTLTSHPNA